MKKILNWIYINVNWGNEILMQLRTLDYNIIYILEFEGKKSGLYLELKKLIIVIISMIVFIIMYKYDIQIISNDYIRCIKLYLKLSFIIYIWIIMYYLIRSLYNWYRSEDEDCVKVLAKSVRLIVKLINFIINVSIIYWLLNLNIDVFLQYNIILVIDITMRWMFWIYKNMLDYEIEGEVMLSFLNYPWIMLTIIIILIKLGYNVSNIGFSVDSIALIYYMDDDYKNIEEDEK